MKFPQWITKQFVRDHPEITFVFGDNLRCKGNAGQAGACRYEPNCFGVPTKKLPCMSEPHAFFNDREFDVINKDAIDDAINKIPRDKKIYIIPGIGEGYSQLKSRAPKTYAYLMEKLKKL